MKSASILILFLSLFAFNLLYSQTELSTISVVDSFSIDLSNHYELKKSSIIPFSEKVFIGTKMLSKNEYDINYNKAYFSIDTSVAYSIYDKIIVHYSSLRLSFNKIYSKHTLIKSYSKMLNDSIKIIKSDLTFLSSNDIFGTRMQKSGSIARGFQVGTNRDMTVSSGLRLQLSGKLSDDISIIAALTDENTPIQPEGNSERLDELDRVFIEVQHENASATFGDFYLNERIGEFGSINRKLQGLKGGVNFDNLSASVAVAGARGTFYTMQFMGQEGSQGPYRLTGKNGERNIIVIAGTEKVYIDGVEMKRGENHDYVIEYSNAEITFTTNRLINSKSRMTVDFEYSDQKYRRNYFGGHLRTDLFDKKLNVSFSYQQEGDDKTSPIDLVLSDSDIKKLEDAGDNKLNAIQSGVSLAPEDSNGIRKGSYTKVDTIIVDVPYAYFIYDPGNETSIYNVVFSYVGEGKGDYICESVGKYRFIGVNNGAYAPVKLLPLPESKKSGNIVITYSPTKNIILSGELAGSIWDKNTYSKLDNSDNNGFARNLQFKILPSTLELGSINFGKVGLSLRDRYIDSRFTTLDRINDIEFDREYNNVQNDSLNEHLQEIELLLQPTKEINISSKYGNFNRGDLLNSKRLLTLVNINKKNFGLDYNFDYVSSKMKFNNTNWSRHKGNAFYKYGSIIPSIRFESETELLKESKTDSLLTGSQKFYEVEPCIEIKAIKGISIKAAYSFRDDYLPMNNQLVKESNSVTQSYIATYRGIPEFSTSITLSIRKKKFTDSFLKKGNLNNESVLMRNQSRFNFWNKFIDGNLFYETSTEKAAKLEKLYIQVPIGTGNYRYLGDLNNNGIADEEEFVPTLIDGDFILTTLPSDELFPIVKLKSSTRWRINFSKLKINRGVIASILKSISSETFLRIEENNKTSNIKDIYLFNFNYFLHDSLTVRGTNFFQQDLNIFKNSRELSFRIRYNQRKFLNQFSAGTEKGFYSEKSVRMRMRLVKEINNQTDVKYIIDNVDAPVTAKNARMVNRTDIISDFSYRPISNIEVGFKFGVSAIEDKYPEIATTINANSQSLRFTYSFANKGRIRIEGERNELTANVTTNFIPFEITQGNSLGKNYTWRLNFDYKIAANLQTQVSYDARRYSSGRTIHTMRAEARAYF